MPDVPKSDGGEAAIPPQTMQVPAQPAGGSPQAVDLTSVLAEVKAMRGTLAGEIRQVNERVSKMKKSTRAALAKYLAQKQPAAPPDDADDEDDFGDDDETPRGGRAQERSWDEGMTLLSTAESALRTDPVYGAVVDTPGAWSKAQAAMLRGIKQGWTQDDILAVGKHALHGTVVQSLAEYAAHKKPAETPAEATGPTKAGAVVPAAGMAGGAAPAKPPGVALIDTQRRDAEIKAGLPLGKKH